MQTPSENSQLDPNMNDSKLPQKADDTGHNHMKPEPRYSVSAVACAIGSLGYPDGPDSSPYGEKIRELVDNGEFADWLKKFITVAPDHESPRYQPDSVQASESAAADAEDEWRATRTMATLTEAQRRSLQEQVNSAFPAAIGDEVIQLMPVGGDDDDPDECANEGEEEGLREFKINIMNTNNELHRYTGGRLRDVLDPWQDLLYRCPHCGLETPGKDLAPGDLHDTFFSRDCPACGNSVVCIERPLVNDLLANIDNLSPEIQGEVRSFAEQCAKWQKEKLHSVEQLPDIALDHIVLVWDADYKGDETTELNTEIVIRCGEREIYRGPSSWEYYDYFIDACKVLRRKYGNRLYDVIPTERTFNAIWGDKLRAPDIVDAFRERIRKTSRIGTWASRPIAPCDCWDTSTA